MALTSTMYHFDIELSLVDRDVYRSLSLRVARHPSETAEYLLTRLLAYCLEYEEGIAFSRGISTPEEPTISVRNLTGDLVTWVEIGAPDAARLHKASKAAPRVAIYTHKDPALLLRQLSGARIHRREFLELYEVDRELLSAFVQRLERRMHIALSSIDGHLYLTTGQDTLTGVCPRHELTETSS